MSNVNLGDKIAKYNEGLRYYTVQPVDNALCEDGRYHDRKGYGIVNNETGVIEHSSICLPATMFQASHFDDMLASLLDSKTAPSLSVVDTPAEDIVPN